MWQWFPILFRLLCGRRVTSVWNTRQTEGTASRPQHEGDNCLSVKWAACNVKDSNKVKDETFQVIHFISKYLTSFI